MDERQGFKTLLKLRVLIRFWEQVTKIEEEESSELQLASNPSGIVVESYAIPSSSLYSCFSRPFLQVSAYVNNLSCLQFHVQSKSYTSPTSDSPMVNSRGYQKNGAPCS